MIPFNFIETFFFLSLGITFALIITLVYHFKKRMENMEQKCDTMFDIVQNLANEVLHLKTPEYNTNHGIINDNSKLVSNTNNIEYDLHEYQHISNIDDDQSDDDSDNGSDDDSDDCSDDGSNVGSDDDSDDDDDETNDVSRQTFDKITIPNVRVINLNETISLDDGLISHENLDESIIDINDDETDSGNITELQNVTEIHVNKIDSDANIIGMDDEDDDENDDDTEEHSFIAHDTPSKSTLRKLKLANLRTMAEKKELDLNDTMKKSEIIELLMTN